MGIIPQWGGGKFFFKTVPISIWEVCTSRGGVSIFQKCPNLNYYAIILQYYPYKKCRKIKNFWIGSEGGGLAIAKMSEIQKSLIFPMGVGSSLFENFSQIFQFFFFMMAPFTTIEPQTFLIFRIFLAWNFPSFLLFHLV